MPSCMKCCCWAGNYTVRVLPKMPDFDAVRVTPLLSGHSVVPFGAEEAEEYEKNWKGYSYGMVRLQPGGWVISTPMLHFHDAIMKFQFESPDVVVMTYPKCGTTWMQEVVWTMRNNPNLDNPAAAESVNFRVPFLEMDGLLVSKTIPPPPPESPFMKSFFEVCPNGNPANGVFIQMAQAIPHPRTFKTHLPFSLMPRDLLEKAKVVYVMRNPKDLVVSFMHHCRLMNNHAFVGTNDKFIDTFIDGNVLYGSYDLHLKEAFERKSHPNLHIVRFEDMKAAPKDELQRLDAFLQTRLTKDQIEKVSHFTSFDEMKKRDNVLGKNPEQNPVINTTVLRNDGGFYRKGEAGSWTKTLTDEQAAKIDKWQKEKFDGTSITFSDHK